MRMNTQRTIRKSLPREARAGFSLVEVITALGIAGIALLAIVALLPNSLMAARNTIATTQASEITRMIDCDLRLSASGSSATAASLHNSVVYGIPLRTGTTSFYVDMLGQQTPAGSTASYRVQVQVYPAPSGSFQASDEIAPVSLCSILLTWPPDATVNKAASHFEIASSFTPGRTP
jgi:uncharacterized protein (TIGR02598 family)